MVAKKLIIGMLVSLLSLPSYAFLKLIPNYEQLLKAVEEGLDVKAIIHFDQCSLNDKAFQKEYVKHLDGASTRINLTEFKHYKLHEDNRVIDTIENSEDFSGFTASTTIDLDDANLRIFEDNTAKFYLDIFDTNHNLIHSLIWTCDISKGGDENGLKLFVSP